MNVIHGAWIPGNPQDFSQSGGFYLWVENDDVRTKIESTVHPQHLQELSCLDFLKNELAVSPTSAEKGALLSLLLPTFAGQPLPSPELQYVELDEKVTLQHWQVYAYPLETPLKAINNIHFLCGLQASNSRIGSDFLFWYYFSQSLKQILAKDQYVPLLLSRKMGKKIELYRRWQAVSNNYESLIYTAVSQMPLACSQHYQPESLLRHFAEVVLHELLTTSALGMPQVFSKKIEGDFLATILLKKQTAEPIATCQQLPDDFKHWQHWQQKLLGIKGQKSLQLGLQLLEADVVVIDQWHLVFFLSSHQDPSLKVDLADFWAHKDHFHNMLHKQFGQTIEQQILMNLAQAARIYPKCWQSMEGTEPARVQLDLDEAFEFLKESA